jgi:hypothetical protein
MKNASELIRKSYKALRNSVKIALVQFLKKNTENILVTKASANAK